MFDLSKFMSPEKLSPKAKAVFAMFLFALIAAMSALAIRYDSEAQILGPQKVPSLLKLLFPYINGAFVAVGWVYVEPWVRLRLLPKLKDTKLDRTMRKLFSPNPDDEPKPPRPRRDASFWCYQTFRQRVVQWIRRRFGIRHVPECEVPDHSIPYEVTAALPFEGSARNAAWWGGDALFAAVAEDMGFADEQEERQMRSRLGQLAHDIIAVYRAMQMEAEKKRLLEEFDDREDFPRLFGERPELRIFFPEAVRPDWPASPEDPWWVRGYDAAHDAAVKWGAREMAGALAREIGFCHEAEWLTTLHEAGRVVDSAIEKYRELKGPSEEQRQNHEEMMAKARAAHAEFDEAGEEIKEQPKEEEPTKRGRKPKKSKAPLEGDPC